MLSNSLVISDQIIFLQEPMLNLSCAGGHLDFTINTEYSWSTARWTLSNNQSINHSIGHIKHINYTCTFYSMYCLLLIATKTRGSVG
jgi:hypothetical protein